MFDLKEGGKSVLEEREYKKAEIAEILHTRDNQGIKRKLNNYGIEY